jgi:hypothetical protein
MCPFGIQEYALQDPLIFLWYMPSTSTTWQTLDERQLDVQSNWECSLYIYLFKKNLFWAPPKWPYAYLLVLFYIIMLYSDRAERLMCSCILLEMAMGTRSPIPCNTQICIHRIQSKFLNFMCHICILGKEHTHNLEIYSNKWEKNASCWFSFCVHFVTI